MAVAWLLQERDFSIGITSVVFHNRTFPSGGVTARSMELLLAFTQQPEPGGTKLSGPFESENTHRYRRGSSRNLSRTDTQDKFEYSS